MRIFLAIAAFLSWIFGAGLLFAAQQFYAPMGVTLSPILVTMAQAQGAILVGLGVINWMARKADGAGLLAVLAGNSVVQTLSLVVALRIAGIAGAQVAAPAIVIH